MAGRSRNVVLVCEECGEQVVLLGPLSAWRSEGDAFECECGKDLTLPDRRDEKTTDLTTVPDAQRPAPRR